MWPSCVGRLSFAVALRLPVSSRSSSCLLLSFPEASVAAFASCSAAQLKDSFLPFYLLFSMLSCLLFSFLFLYSFLCCVVSSGLPIGSSDLPLSGPEVACAPRVRQLQPRLPWCPAGNLMSCPAWSSADLRGPVSRNFQCVALVAFVVCRRWLSAWPLWMSCVVSSGLPIGSSALPLSGPKVARAPHVHRLHPGLPWCLAGNLMSCPAWFQADLWGPVSRYFQCGALAAVGVCHRWLSSWPLWMSCVVSSGLPIG
jgi:hypothetical protein